MHLRITLSVLGGIAALASVGCTTTEAPDDGPGSGGSNSAGTAGMSSSGTGGSSGSAAGSPGTGGSGGGKVGGGTCASEASTVAPEIADFDGCAVGSDATECAVPAIAGTVLFGGVFAYDDGTGNPEFSVVDGQAGSALSLASTEDATKYGGGFGIWTSGCFDASSYSGVTFWVRGIAPNDGTATMALQLSDTTPSSPAPGMTNTGTCSGTTDTCKSPKATFPVTDTWTQVHAKWSDFKGGDAAGTPVKVTGANIIQFQWDIGLLFTLDAETNEYVPVPAPYELQIDDLAFE